MQDTRNLPRLTWDIFCHVIDNWGDLGVCWRLAAQLAERGQQVRLWVDDGAPLDWMAPGALAGNWPDVEVRNWPRADEDATPPQVAPGDVLVEAFGCEIQPQWVQALQPSSAGRVWLNLEYLSAETYVQRCHGLPSPVLSGPLAGRTKWFFYPGFSAGTGGLLRETGLLHRQAAFDREGWLRSRHIPVGDSPVVSLFCYEPPALPALLRLPMLADARWLVAPGRAQAAFSQAASTDTRCTWLPHLPQTEFDHLLWACDLNFVRGEDSLVRALWAGKPFVWQIYPQHDDAHHAKLDAFLDWLQAPASLRAFHHTWNGVSQAPLGTPALEEWGGCALAARERLLRQDDLLTQLLGFVTEKR
jgi:uncharacterized repeat protein (TIGR03837 family)